MNENVADIFKTIESHGYVLYYVGGCVRDHLLGIPSSDYDFTTDCPPDLLADLFPNSDLKGIKFGTVAIHHRDEMYEITTFRKESDYKDFRHPSEILFSDDIKDDLKRRDFSINAMAMTHDGDLIDYYRGRVDLEHKIIRAVGDPNLRIQEDALRILRALRIASMLDFYIDEFLAKAIENHADLLEKISYQRKKDELSKIFTNEYSTRGINLLKEYRIDRFLPGFSKDILKELLFVESKHKEIYWALVNLDYRGYLNWTFSKKEAAQLVEMKEMLKKKNITKYDLYRYSEASLVLVNDYLKIHEDIQKEIEQLPIRKRSDLLVSGEDLVHTFQKKHGVWIKNALFDAENAVLNGTIENNRTDLLNYLEGVVNYGA